MTLGDIIRDIYSRLGLEGDDHSVYYDDIVKIINDTIKTQRVNYIQNEIGYELSTTETLNSFSEDSNFPFVNSGTLSNKLISDLPVELTVLNTTAFDTANTLQDQVDSFSEGDTARKDGVLYEAIDDINSINSYNLTFNPRVYRLFWKNNGSDYNQGEIIYDKNNEDFYKVTSDFTNDQDKEASNITELDKLYWRKVGDANVFTSHYPFNNVSNLKMFDSLGRTEAIAINEDTVYTTKGIEELQITYIPKWTPVSQMSDTVDIPDSMVSVVKSNSLQTIARKLGIQVDIQEQQTPNTQEDNE